VADAPVIVWTDAHLSPRIAAWLRETYNITAAPVSELGLTSAEDSEIFAAARAASAVVMTKDSDFVDLVLRLGPPPQIIWLTCGNTSNSALRVVLRGAWPQVVRVLGSGEPLVEIGGGAGPTPPSRS
jgi:predicted nuclease of predicted toxin-antitoxin system